MSSYIRRCMVFVVQIPRLIFFQLFVHYLRTWLLKSK
jgi:hypothetical protein